MSTNPRPQETNFIVLFQGRTGSSFLIDALDRHPNITAKPELLVAMRRVIQPFQDLHGRKKWYAIAVRSWRRSVNETVYFWPRDAGYRQIKMVQELYEQTPRPSPVVGLKTKVQDITELKQMKRYLEERGVLTIIMERRNLVKQAVSHINAVRLHSAEGKWNVEGQTEPLGPQHISVEEFDRMLHDVVFDESVLNAYAKYLETPKLNVEYSDLLRNQAEWFDTIFDFLGVEPRQLESSVRKNTDDDLRVALSNFEELRAAYADTEFAPMFDEITPQ